MYKLEGRGRAVSAPDQPRPPKPPQKPPSTLPGWAWANQKGGGGRANMQRLADKFGIYWWYKWSIKPEPHVSELFTQEHIQMLACDVSPKPAYGRLVQKDQFQQYDDILGEEHDGYLMVLNEPERHDQCWERPNHAREFYRALRLHAPLAKDIGPNVSNEDYEGKSRKKFIGRTMAEEANPTPNDWWWYRSVLRHLKRNNIALPYGAGLHTYLAPREGPAPMIESFLRMCNQEEYDPQEIWITEFAVETPAQLTTYVDYYRAHPLIKRYAYFGITWWESRFGKKTFLMDENNKPTPIGKRWLKIHDRR